MNQNAIAPLSSVGGGSSRMSKSASDNQEPIESCFPIRYILPHHAHDHDSDSHANSPCASLPPPFPDCWARNYKSPSRRRCSAREGSAICQLQIVTSFQTQAGADARGRYRSYRALYCDSRNASSVHRHSVSAAVSVSERGCAAREFALTARIWLRADCSVGVCGR